MARPPLPIFEIEQALVDTLRTDKRVIVSAPPGSGKSTQVPQMLLDAGIAGAGQIVVLQPRRLATRMLARWVARARNVPLGGEVGYQMRLDNVVSAATRICYATEGVLLRRILSDPDVDPISAIIFDEFHERHLYGDVTLARALHIQKSTRPDLVIVVMSATLDVATLERYLAPCAVLSARGRAYPVTVEYLPRPADAAPVWQTAVGHLDRMVRQYPDGDTLIFMPGAYEIARTIEHARSTLGSNFMVLPLHGEMERAEQDAALVRYERRKVIVATNVAETSLTIDGVRLVIDSGLARIARHDPFRGINTLWTEKISRASADQRAGRAGRTAPGHCLRLWTRYEHDGRPAHETPEVKRLDLSEVVLTLKALGTADVRGYPWLESPAERALERAETLLADLGAVDSAGNITALGRRMLAFPIHPRYARMLLAAHELRCVQPVALIAALMQGRDLLPGRRRKSADGFAAHAEPDNANSDIFLLMHAWRQAERSGYDAEHCRRLGINAQAARQVGAALQQFLAIAAGEGLHTTPQRVGNDAIRRCLLAGFSDHVARRLDTASRRCELVHGRRGVLSEESVVESPLFVACEVREVESGSGRDRGLKVSLSLATAIEEPWLRELFPQDVRETRVVVYDSSLGRVVTKSERRFRDLVLQEEVSGDAPTEKAAKLLAREVLAGRCSLDNWNDGVEQWILRVNLLREWMPELELPSIGDQERVALIEHVCYGACSANEVKNRPVLPVVRSWLSRPQQDWLDQYAPERLVLPNGRAAKVVYSRAGAPTVAARIQDLYGVKDGLWIASRRVRVRVQVLAPSNRPVQVTENLSDFWRDTYPKLKAQLQRRYPKHDWR